ncbi:MAG TPA: hypothetical protein VFB30_12325, partial [Spirochaetia bacterium]|nr:hypothetical protein [Spirochaetia bacterium]
RIAGTKRLISLFLLTTAILFGCVPYQLKAVLDGPQGTGLSISPSATVLATSSTFTFAASGGVGPYAYTLVSGGGSVDPVTGLYTASATAGTAVIQVMDKTGKSVDALVTILPPPSLAISPSPASVTVNGSLTFVATGGIPPYTFSLLTNGSGSPGIVTTGNLGSYVAGSTQLNDVVQLKDSALPTAHTITAVVTMLPPPALTISPSPASVSVNGSLTFVATGGIPPYFFSITTAGSGSPTISTSGNLGSYVAGSTPSGDVVQLKDSALPTAHTITANVTVL